MWQASGTILVMLYKDDGTPAIECIDICQRLRGRKNWVCPGGLPPLVQL